ncbi:hypothetical protein FKW77_010050 [Venturia effusa]|uniref:Mid2 domain-containing protein n=1 Tax=Venturia effusa TaxID=50376 RepID=A0A517L284_9PEZI|nr:hypothetical protein FKW77_010050 [Venturia effusa]
MKSHIAALAIAAHSSWALVAPGPSPTGTAVHEIDPNGTTPKPTTAAILHPGLAKRQNGQSLLGYLAPDNTCGYVSGSLGAVKTCSKSQQCAAVVLTSTEIGIMGCCDNDGSACNWYGDCVGYSDYFSGTECGQACKQDVNTIKCTGTAKPYCYPYSMPGLDIGWFSCDSVSQTVFDDFLSTFIGETDGRTWEPLYDTTSGSSAKLKPSSAVGNALSTILGGTVTISVPAGPASTSRGGSESISKTTKKKTSLGPIIGGVVGGLAVIGAIILGVIVALMKKRKNKADAAATLPPTGMNAPPTNPDMRQSMYGQPPTTQGPYPQGPYPPQQQQQYPQQYQQPQQFDQNAVSSDPGFFAAGKTGQNSYHAKQDGGVQITEQAVPITPLPPASPAPPYVQPAQQGRESWNQSLPTQNLPPQLMQQGPYQPPQLQSQGPAPVELGTNASTPQRNAEGRPVYEAA